ncbi:ExeA family protein [Thioalbus denitrificans]|uniref:Type II secretion system protein A n=1 Tax=Thioalbus denitrificans TaxID=547122 RepID=A0A369C8Q8_9GAMM|nr:ExeA family protein [Thioalbus denitrificans]RCX29921.1 type II secretion system protein A [Thioalbus denitrificans]
MYEAYFGIGEDPFSITPDPRYLYMSGRHQEALAHLLFGLQQGGGFVQLTGEVGTGKTTLCRSLVEQVPEQVDLALILNPRQTPVELLASLCDELHVDYPGGTASIKTLVDRLNAHLLEAHARGRRTVLVIDEAQNLSPEVLEQVRLLTNLETATEKLLQILLIGQPELREVLARPDLRQLAQRITARYHLTPLSADETGAYVRHRLAVAGLTPRLFTPGAVRQVHRLSGGVPRLINILCQRALLGAYAEGAERVDADLVRRAEREVSGRGGRSPGRVAIGWALAVGLILGGAVAWRLVTWEGGSMETVAGVAADAALEHPGVQSLVAGTGSATPAAPPAQESPSVAAGRGVEPGGGAGETEPRTKPGHLPPLAGAFGPSPALAMSAGESAGEQPLHEALLSSGNPSDTVTALTTLFGYWGVNYQALDGRTACDRALRAELECLHGSGNWARLIHYDRPAILELVDREGGRHQVVLAQLDADRATLDFGGARSDWRRSEVESHWYGEYLLLWRRTPAGVRRIDAGDTGPEVIWLRRQLALAEGVPAPESLSDTFDAPLAERVRAFQRDHGLVPDAIVGQETLIQLINAGGQPGVPRLSKGIRTTAAAPGE